MSLRQNKTIFLQEFGAPIGGKKSDQAYGMLKRAILYRHYPPHSQILEQTVAGELQCSQSTVREALLHLAKDGLVERRGYRGTTVTDTSLTEAVAMVRIRLTIERDVARRLGAQDGAAPDPALVTLLERMDQMRADRDFHSRSDLDRDFHSQLAIAARMELVSPILQRCSLHIHRYTLGSVEVAREFYQEGGVGAEHRLLLSDIYSGSQRRAETAIVEHLADVLQRWAPSLYDAVGAEAFACLKDET